MDRMEEQIRERIKGNGFMVYNHMELEVIEPDRAVFRLEIRPESRNVFGMVHGGALYTLADNAAGSAVHTDGRSYVTQDGGLHFLRNQAEGVVRATGTVRHRGRSTALVSVEVTGEDGIVLAMGDFSFFCVDRSRMAERVRKEFA